MSGFNHDKGCGGLFFKSYCTVCQQRGRCGGLTCGKSVKETELVPYCSGFKTSNGLCQMPRGGEGPSQLRSPDSWVIIGSNSSQRDITMAK